MGCLVVKKFGGTSMGSLDKIVQVAEKIVAARSRGEDIVVVVSAMADETERLLALAQQLSAQPSSRELDMLASTGEMVSSALLAIALNSMEYATESLVGQQIGIFTDSCHGEARIVRVDTKRILCALEQGKIVVVAGFQGINENGDITTLGRGGSDATAVALAAALGAKFCEINTDVDGVYTADPNIVPNARRLDYISYAEMLELANYGARVLQSYAVELAAQYKVQICVKHAFIEGRGTWIKEHK